MDEEIQILRKAAKTRPVGSERGSRHNLALGSYLGNARKTCPVLEFVNNLWRLGTE
jgi:hypothetical protein